MLADVVQGAAVPDDPTVQVAAHGNGAECPDDSRMGLAVFGQVDLDHPAEFGRVHPLGDHLGEAIAEHVVGALVLDRGHSLDPVEQAFGQP